MINETIFNPLTFEYSCDVNIDEVHCGFEKNIEFIICKNNTECKPINLYLTNNSDDTLFRLETAIFKENIVPNMKIIINYLEN